MIEIAENQNVLKKCHSEKCIHPKTIIRNKQETTKNEKPCTELEVSILACRKKTEQDIHRFSFSLGSKG